MPTGIRRRGDSWEAFVWLPRERRKVRKTFPTLAAAKSWRADAAALASRGGLRAPKPTTVREAWENWHAGAQAGTIRNRSGDPYKPSALRAYERAMRLRLLPEFGGAKLTNLQRPDLQRLVYRLSASGLSASTVRVALMPLRAVLGLAQELGDVAVNPCDGLKMPAIPAGRDRYRGPRRGGRAHRRRSRPGPGAVGDGDVRRASRWRAAGAPGRLGRPRRWRDSRRARLG